MTFSGQKIVVLKGGFSRERDVSLRSGAAIAAALKRLGHDVDEVDVGRDIVRVLLDLQAKEKIAAVFIALHGRWGEDGCVQGLLEMMGLTYTGSKVLGSALAMDKSIAKKIAMSLGIATPRASSVLKSQDANSLQAVVTEWMGRHTPMIIKPNREGSTIGMSRLMTPTEASLKEGIEQALACDEEALIEECIVGREVTVSVLQGRVLPVVEVVPKSGFYDYQSKYTKGMTDYHVPASLPTDIVRRLEEASSDIYQHMKLSGGVRADFMIAQDGNPYFLEVNTSPGMTETSLLPKAAQAAGISFDELCGTILEGARS